MAKRSGKSKVKIPRKRQLHVVTFNRDEHYQNAMIGDIRVDVERLPKYSKLVRLEDVSDKQKRQATVLDSAPPDAQAYHVDRGLKYLRVADCVLIDYFAINEVLGMRTGWAPLKDPFGPADETNLEERDREGLKAYRARFVTFRRMGHGVNIYAATREQVKKILGKVTW